MSIYLELTAARIQSRAVLHGTWLDGGTLEIYTGSMPATPGDAITDQTLLCAFSLADPAGSATDGVFLGTIPDNALILDDGTAAWGRAKDSAGAVVWDAPAGSTGSGNVIELANVALISGGYAEMTSLTVTEH